MADIAVVGAVAVAAVAAVAAAAVVNFSANAKSHLISRKTSYNFKKLLVPFLAPLSHLSCSRALFLRLKLVLIAPPASYQCCRYLHCCDIML